MKRHRLWAMALLGVIALATPAQAKTVEYNLVIERQPVNITGKSIEKITVNGGIPAPVTGYCCPVKWMAFLVLTAFLAFLPGKHLPTAFLYARQAPIGITPIPVGRSKRGFTAR